MIVMSLIDGKILKYLQDNMYANPKLLSNTKSVIIYDF